MLKLKNMWETLDGKAIENEEDKVPEKLAAKIKEIIAETGMPVTVELDQVKEGMINSLIYDCVTLTNSEHGNRYYKFAIVYGANKRNVTFLAYGESKNLKKLEKRTRAKDNVKSGASGLFGSGSSAQKGMAMNSVVSSAVGGIMSLGGSKKKQEQENQYYDQIHMLMQSVI